ncbi:MAG: glycosyltransferase [Candidatus Levybacteria bacterium]|nr:glycosyltransferase [Candidatus Levybacteria bacterium]
MKIGIFDPYLDDLGGGEKYMVTLAECLSLNNSVTVFWNKKDDLDKVAKRFSLNISKIRLKKNIFSPDYPFFKRCLDSLYYDAIIVLSDGSMPFVLSKKLFVHFQQPFPNLKMSIKTIIKKIRASSFFCNSYFTKSFIDREFRINSQVLYPPIDIKARKIRKENIILHVGRFRTINIGSENYKKQDVMIDLFKKMVDGGTKNWKLVLAIGLHQNDRPKFDNLRKKANGYPIEFLINLNNDKLSEAYSKSKIYWHATGYGEDLSKNPELAEHFGISTVEAMGYGAVPVVINAGGQREIVEDKISGYLWDTLEDFIDKTNRLIKSSKQWKEMSKEAVKRAEKFSGERFCKELVSIIR